MDSLKKILRDLGALFILTALFFILTYPLIFHFSTAIVGDSLSDAPLFLWNVWELHKLLINDDFSFMTRDIFFPFHTSLILHTFTPIQSLITLFFQEIFHNLIIAFNGTFLVSTILAGYGAYRVFFLLTKNHTASILAGNFFIFQPIWSIYVSRGTQNLLSIWYLPWVIYFYLLGKETFRLRYFFLSGIMLGLSFINEPIIFVFAATALGLHAVHTERGARATRIAAYFRRLFAVCGGFLLIAFFKIQLLLRNTDIIRSVPIPSNNDVDYYHSDIINIFRPSHFHPLWGAFNTLYRDVSISQGNAFIGFTFLAILFLALFLRVKYKRWYGDTKLLIFFVAAYCATVTLTWGPYLHIFGFATHLPMPYALIHKIIPQFNNLRVPMRFFLEAQFFLAGILCLLVNHIHHFIAKKWYLWIFVIGLLGIAADVAYLPRPLFSLTGPSVKGYEAIAKDSARGSVLSIPMNISSGYFILGYPTHAALAYQTIHGRPLIDGHLSRLSPSNEIFYRKEPVIKYFLDYEKNAPDADDLNKEKIQAFMKKYAVEYAVFDKKIIDETNDSTKTLIAYCKKNLSLSPWYEDDYLLILKK